MDKDLGALVQSAHVKEAFSRDMLLKPTREIELKELTARGADKDNIMNILRMHYFARINWPTNPHHMYRIDGRSRRLGIGRRTIQTFIDSETIYEERIEGIIGLISEHDMVRAFLRPSHKYCYTPDICIDYAISLAAVQELSATGMINNCPYGMDTLTFFYMLFPRYKTPGWENLARLPAYPSAVTDVTDLTEANPLVTSGRLRPVPSRRHLQPDETAILKTNEKELVNEPPKNPNEPNTKDNKNIPEAEPPKLEPILERLVLRKPAYVRKSEFPFQPEFDFSFIPYNGQHPDAFYVRSIDFERVGRRWVDPKLIWNDAYRLYLAMAYLTEKALRVEFKHKGVIYSEKEVRDSLDIASMNYLLYKGKDVFPLGTFGIVTTERSDLERIGRLVRPVVKRIGPFATWDEITLLLGHPLNKSDFREKVSTQIASIPAQYAELFNFFQVVRAYESEFAPVLNRS